MKGGKKTKKEWSKEMVPHRCSEEKGWLIMRLYTKSEERRRKGVEVAFSKRQREQEIGLSAMPFIRSLYKR